MFDMAQGLFLHLGLREVNLKYQVYSLMMFSGNQMTATMPFIHYHWDDVCHTIA